jgi:hypothetical protein
MGLEHFGIAGLNGKLFSENVSDDSLEGLLPCNSVL